MDDHPRLSHLSDTELASELRRLVACERRATAALIASLAEFDARRLHVAAGFSSLFTYCTQHLRLSEGAAYRRIEAARTCRRFPIALGMLSDGALTLTTLTILAPCLTAANHVDVLARAVHKSRRKIEIIAAELQPRPDAADVIRRLPRPRPSGAGQDSILVEAADASAARASAPEAAVPEGNAPEGIVVASAEPAAAIDTAPSSVLATARAVAQRDRSGDIEPLAPERFKLQVTIGRETHDTLREIQTLIRHAVPTGDLEEIVSRAFRLLRDQLLRQKAGHVQRPRAAGVRHSKRSRYIPARVRRKVWARDGAQCAFAGPGGRCEERAFLEFHHLLPFAAGGADDESNIQLRCRAHNKHEAELFFGEQHMRDAVGRGHAGNG